MSAEKGKKRLDWLDAAKAVALLLVLVSHSMRDEMRETSRALDIIYRLAYCFQMPFFFWLTGFTYWLTRKAGANGKALVKRTKRQLLPWAAYTLFIFAVFSAACLIPSLKSLLNNAGYSAMPFPRYLLMAVQANNPWSYHLWFILVLFLITVLVTLADMLLGKHANLLCLVLIGAGFAVWIAKENWPLGEWWRLTEYLSLYVPWFALGMLTAMHWDKISRLPAVPAFVWGGLGLAYAVVRVLYFSGFSGNSLQVESTPIRILVHALGYVLLSGLMVLVCRLLGKAAEGGAVRKLAVMGRNSFPIYLFHQPFCCAFLGALLYGKLHLPALLTMAVCFISSLLLPWALIKIKNLIWEGRRHDSK